MVMMSEKRNDADLVKEKNYVIEDSCRGGRRVPEYAKILGPREGCLDFLETDATPALICWSW